MRVRPADGGARQPPGHTSFVVRDLDIAAGAYRAMLFDALSEEGWCHVTRGLVAAKASGCVVRPLDHQVELIGAAGLAGQ